VTAAGTSTDLPAGLLTADDVPGDLSVECDVVVVGSGAGGATTAAELADGGLDVVVVEEGGYHPTASFSMDVPKTLRTLYRDGGAQSAFGRPPIAFSEGRCVGGSTVVNGGMAFRTPDRILQRWARDGLRAITPEAMAPYFDRVERRLSVGPQDPESIGRDNELFRLGAERQGWRLVRNTRNQLHCCGCNACLWGCPTGAKRSMLVTDVPRALSRGARLYAGCRVERITRVGSRATGVVGRFRRQDGGRGPRLRVRASVVVAAGGAVQSPALIRRSGFRSPSGQLGRNLALHPNARVIGIFDEDVRGWHGVHQAYQVREFTDDGILLAAANLPPALVTLGLPHYGAELGELMADYNRMVVAGCLVEDTTTGRVRTVPGVGPVVSYQLDEVGARRLVRGITLTAQTLLAAGARRVLLPIRDAPEVRSPRDLEALVTGPVDRSDLDLFTVHLMGTARMDDDARRGVVSSFGEFHGATGLFVADAGLFPGPVGINPMETIVALAVRNAEELLGNWRRHAG
jgi:choline dehydrogenase-like flavoprotein